MSTWDIIIITLPLSSAVHGQYPNNSSFFCCKSNQFFNFLFILTGAVVAVSCATMERKRSGRHFSFYRLVKKFTIRFVRIPKCVSRPKSRLILEIHTVFFFFYTYYFFTLPRSAFYRSINRYRIIINVPEVYRYTRSRAAITLLFWSNIFIDIFSLLPVAVLGVWRQGERT